MEILLLQAFDSSQHATVMPLPLSGIQTQMLRLCGLCGFIAFNVKTGINCSNLTDSSKQMTAYLMEWDHPNQKVKFLKLYSSEQH